jgi:hypothetical protein
MTETLYIGASGFTAAGWSGTFFPRTLPTREYLSYYASRFNTVELMSTLYGPPAMSTIKNWYSQTPKDFVFAVKMPRQFTYGAALINCPKDTSNFFRIMDQLKEKLGPILFKFSLKDIGLLEARILSQIAWSRYSKTFHLSTGLSFLSQKDGSADNSSIRFAHIVSPLHSAMRAASKRALCVSGRQNS